MSDGTQSCRHSTLQLETSAYAAECGFKRPPPNKRAAATTKSGRVLKTSVEEKNTAATFPGPLVLPDDELHWDPKAPAQSFRSWLHEKHRNKITSTRKTLYVAAVPNVDPGVDFMQEWTIPNLNAGKNPTKRSKLDPTSAGDVEPLDPNDLIEYLTAFYHGLPVQPFPTPLRFVPWPDDKPKHRTPNPSSPPPKHIALATPSNLTRIRLRPSPHPPFTHQLNLDDILDAAIAMLPPDAYALVLLIEHDMYESPSDDFCCGRAYGGSRVAVVSSVRYRLELDRMQGIEGGHVWPASHCGRFVDGVLAEEEGFEFERDLEVQQVGVEEESPMRAAVDAAGKVEGEESGRGVWFSRVCRTVAHELGHCFGLDHCVYYACGMQGTAGMREDVRQPPYLCLVCLAKVGYAVSTELLGGGEVEKNGYVRERYEALWKVCARWDDVGMFAGFGAWLDRRLEQMTLET
ncbi:hypothetical protein EJ04DRAFT_549615 [Polyplosphaeria fusca]|uniref:Archaemetzincin-2 n=1 Tax=Polyplosphaeria fusca TaxID=682080 RepID=A0A9P4V6U7_9PLEO|nr:hypothetical protein EJ04DRAFT_549615 [Polyplosphaeria fusca]